MENNTTSLYERALSGEHAGHFAEALQLFRLCVQETEHDDGDVLFHCGWCCEQGGNEAQALHYYTLAAVQTRVPDCKLNSYFRAGWIHMHLREYANAALHFRKAIDFAEFSKYESKLYHESVFWYAVSLEPLGRFIEAIKWYRLVRKLSPGLDPESRLREISCLTRIGAFDEALELCASFDEPRPLGFSAERYDELCDAAFHERQQLLRCLATS